MRDLLLECDSYKVLTEGMILVACCNSNTGVYFSLAYHRGMTFVFNCYDRPLGQYTDFVKAVWRLQGLIDNYCGSDYSLVYVRNKAEDKARFREAINLLM